MRSDLPQGQILPLQTTQLPFTLRIKPLVGLTTAQTICIMLRRLSLCLDSSEGSARAATRDLIIVR